MTGQKRKGQTGEYTTNTGHFGAVVKGCPDDATLRGVVGMTERDVIARFNAGDYTVLEDTINDPNASTAALEQAANGAIDVAYMRDPDVFDEQSALALAGVARHPRSDDVARSLAVGVVGNKKCPEAGRTAIAKALVDNPNTSSSHLETAYRHAVFSRNDEAREYLHDRLFDRLDEKDRLRVYGY